MEYTFRVFDYNIYNCADPFLETEEHEFKDNNQFMIQMFGVDEHGKTYSITVDGFKPFFYVMVKDSWTIAMKEKFIAHLKEKMSKSKYYDNSITDSKIIRRKKLYGFDNKKEHKFIFIEFANMNAFNKAKNLWYTDYQSGHTLLKNGYNYFDTDIKLYEANIPPLLRFFHIKDISPSGWITVPKKKIVESRDGGKTVNCDYQFSTNLKNIIPLNEKETRVPYKIMSFDIEASSSHGDFPVPIKTYKKLATNIVEYFENVGLDKFNRDSMKEILARIILTAFGYDNVDGIDIVYPKQMPSSKDSVLAMIQKWLTCKVRSIQKTDDFKQANTLETIFEKISKETEAVGDNEEDGNDSDNPDEHDVEPIATGHGYNTYSQNKYVKEYGDKTATIVDVLMDKKYEREGKLNELNISLNAVFPKLEGDKVTFIGSTFMNYGNKDPHLNHCIVLNTCSSIPMENSVVESYNTEKEVLLAWQDLVQRENPDIIIGYNIFGFDYEFMFRRAEENDCVEDFLKLSRNKEEVCATRDKDTGKYKIEESSIQIASGQHDLRFIKMNGRLQIDLYNFYRRTENLTSYKLDYVAGNFIGDYVKKIEADAEGNSVIYTSNLTGLLIGSNIHFEEIGHSVDYYADGAKYLVSSIDKTAGCKFVVKGAVSPDFNKKIRWCLAKDDVSPKDIFRLSNGSCDDRAIVAKYCIQDCNLVHYLFNKSDVLTGFIEMAKICSVPINFLVMRGQGIKLQSLIANECRKIKTLIPVIEKGDADEGYEGAIVLDPKCNLYLDNPVACNDYASLYPSSMISENLSHDSKVWTQEYDLAGNLVEEWGYKDEQGNFIYDNLPEYEYVDVRYDTYRYYRKHPKAAAEKVKCGFKICRYAQFPDGESAIMPAILKKLLKARKDTRKMIPNQTDEFMKQVLEQRQLGYKVTANSLYGGCGAKTSSFYEKDIAACTTAMGRKLLTYGKRIIEECYKNKICETKNHGQVLTNAEYIYGDTDSVFYTFNLQTLDGQPIRGKTALEITIELAQEAGDIAARFLKGPHDFEYEKTFMPFCLLSKKRYVGMLYETVPNKCKRKEMGIVLKRRDNAPIVKDIYGGIIDILMKKQNISEAIDFLRGSLQNIVDEKYPIEKLVITKSLRSGYKNPKSIAHKVLADRITARDPGNKPGPGDRIPFAYISVPGKKVLQGDKIETPAFIIENNLKIDYSFYITNQIMKPVQQLFALVIEQIWTMQRKRGKLVEYRNFVEKLRRDLLLEIEDDDAFRAKYEEKVEQKRCKEVKALLFDEYIRETNNEKAGMKSITKFFARM
jgi:DNA polymerase elongation subunit (family B)